MNDISMFSSAGQKQEPFSLGVEIPKKEKGISSRIYSCAIKVLLQNWRQGTVGCKTRGEVAFANKKPWRQKGTGRARAGSLRSPLWRKGGIIFGPQPRVRKLKINHQQKRMVLSGILQAMLENQGVYCFDCDFEGKLPKTKEVFSALKNAGVCNKKGILFLSYEDELNFAAFRNISGLGILSFDQPNVFDLSNVKYWMFLKKDLGLFKDMVSKWI